jgi:uncharacterized protein YecT (DUF1311 family)
VGLGQQDSPVKLAAAQRMIWWILATTVGLAAIIAVLLFTYRVPKNSEGQLETSTTRSDVQNGESKPQPERGDTYCSSEEEFEKARASEQIADLNRYIDKCSQATELGSKAMAELEARIFLDANNCIVRESDCNMSHCIGIYEHGLPGGARLTELKRRAAIAVSINPACNQRSQELTDVEVGSRPVKPTISERQDGFYDQRQDRHAQPDWCGNSKQKSGTERLICSDSLLGELDAKMNRAYQSRLSGLSGPGRPNFIRGARAWLKRRDQECSGLTLQMRTKCLQRITKIRIDYLEGN